MKWQNIGSAPCYRPYRVAFRLTSPGGQQQVFVSDITVNKWLPGSIELFTEEFFKEPKDLPPGEVAQVVGTIVLPSDLAPGDTRSRLRWSAKRMSSRSFGLESRDVPTMAGIR